jgi:hypothetical protein
MSLFGPKAPCPHCGQKVKKPHDPESFLCPHCGEPGPWATKEQITSWTHQRDAQEAYRRLLGALTNGDGTLDPTRLRDAAAATGFTPRELEAEHIGAFKKAAAAATADDILTPEEDAQLGRIQSALGLPSQRLMQADPDLYDRIAISTINGGVLPEVASPHILPKKGEIVHAECPATLMKEVAIREYQGGYRGFSFPIGKTGIRYRVGGARGHSVEVGTKLNVADTGLLSITNKRAVYAGTRKTVEMPYSKLVNLSVFSDGLQFHLSNRVNAPLFQIQGRADVFGAVVNAAAQTAEGAPPPPSPDLPPPVPPTTNPEPHS